MTSSRPITRCHSLKLVNNRYYYDLGKFSFAPRIVSVWNSLPEIVISADTSDAFKIRLDNNNNNNRISIPPLVVTSEAVAEPVRSRKSAIVG